MESCDIITAEIVLHYNYTLDLPEKRTTLEYTVSDNYHGIYSHGHKFSWT